MYFAAAAASVSGTLWAIMLSQSIVYSGKNKHQKKDELEQIIHEE